VTAGRNSSGICYSAILPTSIKNASPRRGGTRSYEDQHQQTQTLCRPVHSRRSVICAPEPQQSGWVAGGGLYILGCLLILPSRVAYSVLRGQAPKPCNEVRNTCATKRIRGKVYVLDPSTLPVNPLPESTTVSYRKNKAQKRTMGQPRTSPVSPLAQYRRRRRSALPSWLSTHPFPFPKGRLSRASIEGGCRGSQQP
jgi:hypothetical protein